MNSDQKIDEIIRLLTEISNKMGYQQRWVPDYPQVPTMPAPVYPTFYYCNTCKCVAQYGHVCQGSTVTCSQTEPDGQDRL